MSLTDRSPNGGAAPRETVGPGSASYVLGSGPSLLDLTSEERTRLTREPFVFAMNKYLLFWDKIGVEPSHTFLADTHYPAYEVLARSLARSRELRRPPRFHLHRYYRDYINVGPAARYFDLVLRARLIHNGGWRGRYLEFDPTPNFFAASTHNFEPMVWARSFEEQLYFYRGSLSILLNLICILNPGRPIYLLGVDMNTPESFYEEEMARDASLHDKWRAIGEREAAHPTVLQYESIPGILEKWPFIWESCLEAGCPIYNVNPASMLVERGLCEARPLSFTEGGEPMGSLESATPTPTPHSTPDRK